ncbi:MAG: outer membrane protein assembly factor [Rhizobiaceae bacterium]|nr:outer membrane protein assembly factor [Rhizobiaceae bacterium]
MPASVSRVSGGSFCGRTASLVLLCACISLATPGATPGASAFELFGIKLLESDDADADIVDPLTYTVTLSVEGAEGGDLEDELKDASQLVAEEERPVSGSLGLLSKATRDRDNLIAELYSNARYDGVVAITINGSRLEDLPPDADFGSGPATVAIRVTPGSEFVLGDVAVLGDAADIMPARFGLLPGGDASSDAILKAETDMVRVLKEEGRPLARVASRQIVADHATATLDVTLTLEAGPVAGYGETTVEGTELVDRDFVEYMTDLDRGDIYSPAEIEEARERLLALGVFNTAGVREADALDANGQIPITVEVSERKMRYFGVGVTASNTEGLGVEGYWGHRNLFGRAEKLRIEGSISRIGDTTQLGKLNYNAAVMFEKPGFLHPDAKFFANLKGVFEHPDAYDRLSIKGGVGMSYDLTRTQTISAELALDWSKIDDAFGSKRHLIVSIPLQYVIDRRDDRLDPTKGFRLLAYAEPTYDIFSEDSIAGNATFLKLRGEASVYQSLGGEGRFVIAGRAATGSILGADLDAIPADRRFYSGGGGSVRGYAYQGIGPRDAAGKPTGGRSYIETSVEMRVRINDSFGVVPFVDAGTVSESSMPEFANFKVGAGIGIRYLTPFGPLRVDAAVPLNRQPGDPRFGIYAGVGQSF